MVAGGETSVPPEDRMTLSEFTRVAAPVILPIALLWLSSYLLLVAVARRLEPAELGTAVTVVVLFLIIAASIPPIRRWPLFAQLGLTVLALVVVSPVLSAVFHLGFESLGLLLPSVVLSGLRVRSTDRPGHGRSSIVAPALAAAMRVLSGIAFVAVGLGISGVLLALMAGEVTGLVFDRLLWAPVPRHERSAGRDGFIASSGSSVLVGLTLAVFVHADVLLARHFLPLGAAGGYAGAAMVARGVLLAAFISALGLRAAVAPIRDTDPFRWLRQWVATGAAGVLTVGLVLVLFREPILRVVLGANAGSPLSAFSLMVAGICLLTIALQLSCFHWVVDSRTYILTIVGIVLEVVVVAVSPATDVRIAGAMLVSAGLIALLQYQASWAITRWSPPLSLLRSHEEVVTDIGAGDPVDQVELSIIVPCHNAGPGLRDFLAHLEGEFSAASSFEIIVVSDGSTDETLATARELASPTLRVMHYPERAGKGHALRVGLSRARGEYVGFIDSDGDIDPRAIGPFLTLMRMYEPDIVLGSKRHPMSQVAYPPMRRIMSWVYHKLTRLLFRVNVRDTQTGLKVVRREVLADVLPRMFEKRYAWDLELLVVARTLGFTKVFEAPVRIEYHFSSQVDPNAAFRIILDSAAIFYRRYVLNSYRHTAHRLAVIREPQARV